MIQPNRRPTSCRNAPSPAASLLLALGIALLPAAAAAAATDSRIGVASAINPEAEGTPPGGSRRVLHVGIDIQADERVTTTANGQVQLLFLDGSAMSIGPNSDLVLDRFVYDPGDDSGELAVRLGRGVLRIVGGRISKREAIRVETTSATMGIRGGIGTFAVGEDGGVTAGFLFGDSLTVTSAGVTRSTDLPGTVIDILPGAPPEPPRIMTGTEVTATLSVFEGREPPPEPAGEEAAQGNGRDGGGQQGGGNADPDGALQRSGLSGESSGDGENGAPVDGDARVATETHLDTESSREVRQPELVVLRRDDDDPDEPVEEEPEVVEAEPDDGDAPEDVPDEVVEEEPTDSDAVERAGDGRLLLTPLVTAYDPETGAATLGAANSAFIRSAAEVGADLAVATATGGSYRFPLVENGVEYAISDADSTAPLAAFSGRMLALADDSFWRAGGRGTAGSASAGQDFLLFGGSQTSLSLIPTTGSTALAVGGLFDPLPFEGGSIPFGSNVTGTALSPLYLRYGPGISSADRTAGLTAPVGFQTSLMISGSGAAQVSLMTGTILTIVEEGAPGSGRPAFAGTLVGSRRDSATATPTALAASVSSAGLQEGSAMFGGSGQYAVLDPSALSLDTASGTVSRSTSAMSATALDGSAAQGEWFSQIVQPGGATPSGYLSERSSRFMRGFTGGVGAARSADGTVATFTLRNDPGEIAPGGILVRTDTSSGRVTAELRVERQDVGGLRTLHLGGDGGGDPATAPTSAFIDNGRYIARDADTMATSGSTQAVSQALVLVTGRSVNPAELWPDAQTCTCEYLDWGFWSGATSWPDGSEERYHMASWVAGELPELVEIPTSGSASYAGQMIGGVIDGAQRHIASGDMNVNWNFGTRAGAMQVNGFDAADYAGSLSSIDGRQITGAAESVAAARTMSVDGSFFSGGGDPVAAMGGSFAVQGQAGYSAAGTWMLDRTN
ncbi:FecR domain-containing protein [Marinibaculum pumilum]|uniref:FecR domain-containing protein n=1 Tax=Marinibaculum pumilum TaxID=1766165 RepID=A0ABV7L6L9_9PROT